MLDALMWLLFALLCIAVLLAAWRFMTLRSRGTSAIMRRVPNPGTRGWRHGVIKYGGYELQFFKLRSVSPQADVELSRSSLDFVETRELTAGEAGFMDTRHVVCVLESPSGTYELVLAPRSAMALRAWVESAPHQRQERIDVQRLRRKFDKD